MDQIVKECSRCKVTLPLDRFAMTTCRGNTLRRSWCRECTKSYYRARYTQKKE